MSDYIPLVKDKLIVQDRNTGEQHVLPNVELSTVAIVREKNNAYSISFTAKYSNTLAFEMLQYENYIVFRGETYVMKQGTNDSTGTGLNKHISATHIFYNLQHRRQYSVKAGEHSLSLTSALAFLFDGIGDGYSYKIHGDFSNKKLTDFGNCSITDGLSLLLETFNVYGIYPYNKVVHLYSKKEWVSKKSRLVAYRHNAQTANLQWDSMNIVNRVQVVSTAEKPLFKPFYVQDNDSVSRWGTHDGNRYDTDNKSKSEAETDAKKGFNLTPNFSLSMLLDNSFDARIGDTYPVKIPEPSGKALITESEVIAVTNYPLVPNSVSIVTFNSPRKNFLDNDRKTKNSISNIRKEIRQNGIGISNSWVVGEVLDD